MLLVVGSCRQGSSFLIFNPQTPSNLQIHLKYPQSSTPWYISQLQATRFVSPTPTHTTIPFSPCDWPPSTSALSPNKKCNYLLFSTRLPGPIALSAMARPTSTRFKATSGSAALVQGCLRRSRAEKTRNTMMGIMEAQAKKALLMLMLESSHPLRPFSSNSPPTRKCNHAPVPTVQLSNSYSLSLQLILWYLSTEKTEHIPR